MNILAIETSTEACSVALRNNEGDVFSEFEITPRQHTRYLPVMLDTVLQKANLQRNLIDFIAYASGPGAFTGVRIAAASAQGIAIGLKKPLVPVSTLAVLAQQACDEDYGDKVIATLDARMNEIYCAYYIKNQQGLVELSGDEKLIKLEQLNLDEGYIGVGSGFQASMLAGRKFKDQSSIFPDTYPTATALVKLAYRTIQEDGAVAVQNTKINYLRNQVAQKKTTPNV